MIETLKLTGIETLERDLDILLNNERCRNTRNGHLKDGTRVRMYNYGCGTINIPIEEFYKKQPFILQNPDLSLSDMDWELFRTATAVWYESLEREINEKEHTVVSSNLLIHFNREKINKQVIQDIFEESNWMTPYYIYWNKKRDTLHAVLEFKESKPVAVVVDKKISNRIFSLFEDSKIGFYDNLYPVKMKRTSTT